MRYVDGVDVRIFPSSEPYVRLVTAYLIEYSEEWAVAGSCEAKRPLDNSVVVCNYFDAARHRDMTAEETFYTRRTDK